MLDWIRRNRKNPFGSTLLRIPTPHFVVFYNGREKRPELLVRSMVLQGYAYFVESVRELAKTEDLRRKG